MPRLLLLYSSTYLGSTLGTNCPIAPVGVSISTALAMGALPALPALPDHADVLKLSPPF